MTANATLVLEKRYLKKDLSGKVVETPLQMFERVARNLALIDILYHPRFYVHQPENSDVRSPLDRDEVWRQVQASDAYQTAQQRWTSADLEALFNGYWYYRQRGQETTEFVPLLEWLNDHSDELDDVQRTFFEMMAAADFLPNSPCLMNAGRDLQQLSACFVLPVEDSLASIFDSIKNAALIHQSGGGTGFAFSRLRPKNDVVRSTGGVASGPISFLRVFNAATEAVKQGGTRRGANMGILAVNHPDILDFITCKDDPREITNFNISVAITEEFMKAAEAGEEYELINPRNGEVTARLPARAVFEKIVHQAWKNGEPGIVFLDRMNADNPTPHVGMYESTNPCGEQPLLPYEACDLGSVNLGHYVIGAEEDAAVWLDTGLPTSLSQVSERIDWQRLAETVHHAVHFLDNLIDASRYPLPQIEAMHKANRKIGLGVMGWADMLLYLGVPYDSALAEELADKVMHFIRTQAREASAQLAQTRGVFPNFAGSVYDRPGQPRVRNATTTTIAPTGTISLIAGASSGIEPLFGIAFTRHQAGAVMVDVNPIFERVARRAGFFSPEVIEEVAKTGELESAGGMIPEAVRRVFVTAHQISPEWHIRMQAAFQKATDNAVSKTVNFPNQATPEDVAEVYRLAYQLGCKGVTVYRDGSRSEQVLTVGKDTASHVSATSTQTSVSTGTPASENHSISDHSREQEADGSSRADGVVWGHIRPIQRPLRLRGFTEVKETPVGKLFLTLNRLGDHPIELFAQIGKAGSDVAAFTEGIARLVSLALRCGIEPEEVANQLVGIGGSRSVGFGNRRVRSIPDAIGLFLREVLTAQESSGSTGAADPGLVVGSADTNKGLQQLSLLEQARTGAAVSGRLCPECGQLSLMHTEGCLKCMSCGYSEC